MKLEYDCFVRPPNKVIVMECNVCGDLCHVERNRKGIRRWTAGMAGMFESHDWFQCPNVEQPWHMRVLQLMDEMEKTASTKISKILRREIDRLLLEYYSKGGGK